MARMLRGKPLADKIIIECGVNIITLGERGMRPSMASILVGTDKVMSSAAEQVHLECARVSVTHRSEHFGEYASEKDVISCIEDFNEDPSCHGIYIPLPLPEGMETLSLLSAIGRKKDVSGLHPQNLGLMLESVDGIPDSCTAKACLDLVKSSRIDPKGKLATVVGRNWTFCRPMAALLSQAGATVTMTGRDDPNLDGRCREADILVVQENVPNFIKGAMIKAGAVVVDAGTSYVNQKFNGDVDMKTGSKAAKYLSPVPGGYEPLAVALVIRNLMHMAIRQEIAKRKSRPDDKRMSSVGEADVQI